MTPSCTPRLTLHIKKRRLGNYRNGVPYQCHVTILSFAQWCNEYRPAVHAMSAATGRPQLAGSGLSAADKAKTIPGYSIITKNFPTILLTFFGKCV